MKKLVILAVVVGLVGAGEFKLYNVKSGKVTYEIKGSGEVMGSKQKTVGKKRVIFDKYGYRELNEESIVTVINVFGNTQKDSSHKITLRVGDKAKIADFKKKRIYEMNIPMISMIAAQSKDLVGMGESMLKKMGGKKVGVEEVAGYKCDVWKMKIVTQCIYKGVPLKIESNVMGIKQTTIATDAKFDIDIDESSFKLPKFKSQKLPIPGGENMNINPEDMGKMVEQLGKMSAQSGSKSSKEDMANALGNIMLPQMKQQILSQEKVIKFAKTCLERSNTLKDANDCEKMMSKRLNQPSEPFLKWDSKIKKETLLDIEKGLKSMDCIKKANTMKEIQKCQM